MPNHSEAIPPSQKAPPGLELLVFYSFQVNEPF